MKGGEKNMTNTKKIFVIAALSAVVLASPVSIAKAAESNSNPMSTLIERVSKTFGLDKAKVQTVFEAHRKERMAEGEKRMQERLTQAVKDGKITEIQKAAIIKKHEEIKASVNLDAMKALTPEERQTKMKTLHESLVAWAKEQGIDTSSIPFGPMGGRGNMSGSTGRMNRWK